jgi:hypothetical protein
MLAIGLWVAQVVALAVMFIAAVIDVESIIFTGPAFTLVGLAHALVTRSLQSWITLVFALSAPLVCAIIAVLIPIFDWRPNDARLPVITILLVYAIVIAPVAGRALQIAWQWQANNQARAVLPWQFSLKSILVTMTLFCVLLAAARFIVKQLDLDDGVFSGFAAMVALLAALVIWRYLAFHQTTAGGSLSRSPFGNQPRGFEQIMNFKDAIRSALRTADFMVQAYLADITPEEMLARPVDGANHIAWQLGHLIVSGRHLAEAASPGSMPPLPDGFAERHRRDSKPSDNPADYLSKEVYLELAQKTRAGTLAALDSFPDADFDKPVTARVPPFVKCAGDCFATIAPHWTLHAGQWVILRRKLNRPVMI